MHFFCTKNHFEDWLASVAPNPDIYGLPIAAAVAVAQALFGLES
jgi:hypothetical protein